MSPAFAFGFLAGVATSIALFGAVYLAFAFAEEWRRVKRLAGLGIATVDTYLSKTKARPAATGRASNNPTPKDRTAA